MYRQTVAVVLFALAITAGACTSEDDPAGAGDTDPDAFRVELELTGDAEVPGPGSDGSGTATFTIADGEACLEGALTGVGPVQAGHVHSGEADEAGEVVLDLGVTTEEDGSFDSCVSIDTPTAQRFLHAPNAYYVNLHTEEFPDGAVRSQLR